MAENEDRTEPGTARKRQKAREEGRIVRSRELVSMAALAGILLTFWFGGGFFLSRLSGLTGGMLGFSLGRNPVDVMRSASLEALLVMAPFFAVALVLTVLAAVAQDGFLAAPLKMNWERLNPVNGLQQLFSLAGFTNFLKSFLKFAVGIVLVYLVMLKALAVLPFTAAMELGAIMDLSGKMVLKAVTYAFFTFFVLAVVDYLHMRWMYERSIRMTKDEVKEDYKQTEGDPLIKSRIKSVQRELARRRMMQEVPTATVVITNPAHIAVALRYAKGEMDAPRVIAKGREYLAQKIKELARQHSVPVVEDKPLARALFKLPLDASIPADLYRAVAKILAYIYKLRGMAA